MASLLTREAFSQTGQALEALGLPAVKPSSLGALGSFLVALVRAALGRQSRPLESDSVAARLYSMAGFAGYFLFDRRLEREDAYGVNVSSYVQTLRQIKLARALHRGDQLVRNPRNEAAMTDALKTVALMKKFGAYETTVLHRQLLEAKIAWATGASPLELLHSIRSRAGVIQAPWLTVESMMTEAAWHRANGQAAKADELQRALETAATEAGLHGLIARSRRFALRPN